MDIRSDMESLNSEAKLCVDVQMWTCLREAKKDSMCPLAPSQLWPWVLVPDAERESALQPGSQSQRLRMN